ncbi:MAG: glycosyltransferase family 39 protein [Chloroflexi bacterium]|nr:glycosyltransferase family 39 protein [Chloroflexota bacterium]
MPRWLLRERTLSLLLVLVVASVLRLPFPDLTPFGHDEALEAERARPIWYGARPVDSEITSWFIPDPAGLLYYYALAEPFPRPAIARVILISATNVASVLLCYLLARRFFGARVGLLAGLFYAANPWAVTFGRQPWVITQPLLTTVMLMSAMMVVARQDRRWIIPFFLAGAAQTQTHLLAVLFGPPVLLTLALFARRWLAPRLALAIVAAVALVAPYTLHLWTLRDDLLQALGRGNRGITLLPDPTALTLTSWLVSGYNLNLKLGFDDRAMDLLSPLLLTVAVVAVALLVVGAGVSARACLRRADGWRADALLLIWLVAPLALMTWQGSQVYIHYVLCLVPLPFLLMARGASWLMTLRSDTLPGAISLARLVGGAVAAVLVLQAAAVGAFYVALDRIASAPPAAITATQWQSELNRADLTARQIGIGELHGLPLRYWQTVADRTKAAAQTAGIRGVTVVTGVLDADNRHLDRNRKALNYLLGPELEPRFPLEGLTVAPTTRDALVLTIPDQELPRLLQRSATRLLDVPQPGTSSAARLFQVRARPPDDLISLRRRSNQPVGFGVRLVVLDVPTEVRPGQTAPLAAYLLVEDGQPTDAHDLVPYVELTDAEGRRLTFARRGGLPSAEWQTGDLLVQQLNVTVPVSLPDGEYPLRLGLSLPDDDVDHPPRAEGVVERAVVLRVRSTP